LIMENDLLKIQLQVLNDRLKKEQNSNGFWSGMLSSSALSTATAIVALKIYGDRADDELIQSGYNWLCSNINGDGGFGDTPASESNVSTSLLCYAAVYYCQPCDNNGKDILRAVESFL
jgi:squalene-hopene/tetraprenyl-beta-curcumene cyclase